MTAAPQSTIPTEAPSPHRAAASGHLEIAAPLDAGRFDLDWLWLRFRDPQVEAVFTRETFVQSINFIRAYLLAGAALYATFGILDVVVGGRATAWLLAIRWGLVCPFLLAVFGLSFLKSFPRFGQAALSAVMLTSGLAIVGMTAIMPAPFNSLYYAGIIMVVIYCGSLTRIKFRYSILISLALVAAYQASALWIAPIPREMLISNDFFLTMATAVGLFSGHIQEQFIRRAYAGRRIADEARESADAANSAKSQFLATVSHEIRTPLNGVLGMVQAMAHEDLSPAQRERLGVIGQSGEMLLAILNDVLDLSKIEAGKLVLDSADFDLGGLALSLRTTFEPLAQAKGLTFIFEVAEEAIGTYRGDSLRVRQVFHNLISNAVKFTREGSIRVSLDAAPGLLRFTVEDTGVGMSPDQIGQLFDKFVQADSSTTRRFGGTGLGLAISRELAHAMGGEIWAEGEIGRGSRFTVELPLTRVGEAEAQALAIAAETPATASHTLRILAAEDNATNQLVLRTLLSQFGLEPVIVGDGQQAVAAWEAGDWDLILMDAQMPVMDGIAATLAIRRREAETGRAAVPILALTANAMNHQIDSYLAAGMNGVVAKPIQVAELIEAIVRVTAAPPAQADAPDQVPRAQAGT